VENSIQPWHNQNFLIYFWKWETRTLAPHAANKKIEIKLSPPSTYIKQQLLIMNHLIMANILNNGVNFDEFNARLKAHKVHNKHETGFLKNKTNKFVAKSSKMSKTYNNKPTRKLHDRKLRW
jgi:hypothetical protein